MLGGRHKGGSSALDLHPSHLTGCPHSLYPGSPVPRAVKPLRSVRSFRSQPARSADPVVGRPPSEQTAPPGLANPPLRTRPPPPGPHCVFTRLCCSVSFSDQETTHTGLRYRNSGGCAHLWREVRGRRGSTHRCRKPEQRRQTAVADQGPGTGLGTGATETPHIRVRSGARPGGAHTCRKGNQTLRSYSGRS